MALSGVRSSVAHAGEKLRLVLACLRELAPRTLSSIKELHNLSFHVWRPDGTKAPRNVPPNPPATAGERLEEPARRRSAVFSSSPPADRGRRGNNAPPGMSIPPATSRRRAIASAVRARTWSGAIAVARLSRSTGHPAIAGCRELGVSQTRAGSAFDGTEYRHRHQCA
jgi:hypothetical protein